MFCDKIGSQSQQSHDFLSKYKFAANHIHFIFLITKTFIRAIELIRFEDNNRIIIVLQNESKSNLPIWKYIITPV
jgi:hypothetical protein